MLHRGAEWRRRWRRDRDVMVDEKKCQAVEKDLRLSDGSQDGGFQTYFFLFSFPFCAAPTEPLLCKFADGGQKKRQSQSKYPQNGRPWHREGEVRCDTHKLTLVNMCGECRQYIPLILQISFPLRNRFNLTIVLQSPYMCLSNLMSLIYM